MLPAVALCFPALASIIRVNRAEMLETLKQDYIVNARAQGLSTFRIVAVYALRNAMLPTMAMIGLRFGWMLGGTVLVETVFDWPGIGLYAVQAAIRLRLRADHGGDHRARVLLHADQLPDRRGLRDARPARTGSRYERGPDEWARARPAGGRGGVGGGGAGSGDGGGEARGGETRAGYAGALGVGRMTAPSPSPSPAASDAALSAVSASRPDWRERHAATLRLCRLYGRTFSRNGSAMIGLALVLAFLLTAAVGPWFVPFPEDAAGAVHIERKLRPPDAVHWMGTDEVGNDVFTRVVVGARVTLQIALIVTGVAMLIGVPLGMIAGYVGGWAQEAIMRVTDVFLSVPGLILAIAIVGALGPGIVNAMLALSLVWWPGYVRLVQAKTLSLKNEVYVEAAHAMGAGRLRGGLRPHPAELHLADHRQGEHGHGHGDPGGGEPRLPRPRRAAAVPRVGGHDQRRPHVPAGLVVVLLLPGARDLPHRARLQPAGRRPPRPPRPAAPRVTGGRAAPPAIAVPYVNPSRNRTSQYPRDGLEVVATENQQVVFMVRPDYVQGSACDPGPMETRARVSPKPVIPAKAGIQGLSIEVDSRFRGNDGSKKTMLLSFVRNQVVRWLIAPAPPRQGPGSRAG